MATIPSISLIPSGYKAGKVYSVLPTDGSADFDFSRNTTATRINKDGLIEAVAGNTPRLDYPLINGVVNGCPSLLLEPSRTNRLVQSNQFDTTWINTNSVETSGQVGVGGSTDAWLLNKSAQSGHIKQNLSSSGVQTLSVFAKKGSLNWIRIIATGGTSVASTWFDLENGVVGSADFSTVSSNIENYGDGWYRCSITIDVGTITGIRYYPSVDNNNVSGTSGNIYIQYAQLEAGSYATSYIPTSGSAQTRLAETANNAGDASTFNDSEGVLMAEIAALANDGTNRYITLSDGTFDNRLYLLYSFVENQLIVAAKVDSNTVFSFLKNLSDSTQFIKIAVKWKVNDFALWLNGVEVDTDNNGVSFSSNTLSKLSFDVSGTLPFYGKTKDLRVYNTALTDLELETLTSYTSFNAMALALNYTIQ